jgi:hypothetical protein
MQTFTQTKTVLMYREKPKETYYNDQHMFVDLDQQSGGYPCRATMLEAHDFKTVEDAAKYDKKGEFIIGELTIVGTVVVDEKMDSIRTLKVVSKEQYDKELRRQKYEELRKEFE